MDERELILVVDSDASSLAKIRSALIREGYRVAEATTGEAGLEAYTRQQPALVILVMALPTMDGLEICRRLRAKSDVPIVMVSDRHDEVDIVVALELGADDYVVKPFGERELVARIRAMLRRTVLTERATAQQRQLDYPDLRIDLPTRSVVVKGDLQKLTPKEFDLLFFLAAQPQHVFTREEIVDAVWGYRPASSDLRTVDTHVKRLRQKLEEKYEVQWSVATVWGVGYKFEVSRA